VHFYSQFLPTHELYLLHIFIVAAVVTVLMLFVPSGCDSGTQKHNLCWLFSCDAHPLCSRGSDSQSEYCPYSTYYYGAPLLFDEIYR
jgi:hypothetical protein